MLFYLLGEPEPIEYPWPHDVIIGFNKSGEIITFSNEREMIDALVTRRYELINTEPGWIHYFHQTGLHYSNWDNGRKYVIQSNDGENFRYIFFLMPISPAMEKAYIETGTGAEPVVRGWTVYSDGQHITTSAPLAAKFENRCPVWIEFPDDWSLEFTASGEAVFTDGYNDRHELRRAQKVRHTWTLDNVKLHVVERFEPKFSYPVK